jgi:drug/metabolite transporter (DMT)-like permease
MHMMTRHIGRTESGLTMAFYIQTTFILISLGFGAATGDGRFAGQDSIPLEFLFRAWGPIALDDWGLFLFLGAMIAFSSFFISQAYRIAEAGFVAPFEYIAMPLAIFWGIMVFDSFPDPIALLGMGLILFSGLYVIWRETVRKSAGVPNAQRHRH